MYLIIHTEEQHLELSRRAHEREVGPSTRDRLARTGEPAREDGAVLDQSLSPWRLRQSGEQAPFGQDLGADGGDAVRDTRGDQEGKAYLDRRAGAGVGVG